MTCLMFPFAELSWHPDVGAAATRALRAPFGCTCAAAIPAATRHAMTRAPRAPALRLRLMLSSPFEYDRATLYPFGYRGEASGDEAVTAWRTPCARTYRPVSEPTGRVPSRRRARAAGAVR